MNHHMNRIKPSLDPQWMKTYEISAPISTHFRPARCDEVECPNYLFGWESRFDLSTDLGKRQAHYVMKESGRRWTKRHVADSIWAFTFEPGQKCFAAHKKSLEREPLYRILGGDWRGNPRRLPVQLLRAEDWVDNFATHQDRVATAKKRG